MKSQLSLTSGTISDAQAHRAADLFQQHGAVWLKNAFDSELIRTLLHQYRKRYLNLSKKELRQRDAIVGDERFMLTVDLRGKFNQPAVYANPCLMQILTRLLSPYLRIASFGSVVAMPGAEDQPIHLDHPPLFGDAAARDDLPPYAITMVIPLVDITQASGTTAIWEGSHKLDFRHDNGGHDENRIEMLTRLMESPDYSGAATPLPKQGDVYLMDYRVIHGGLANRSDIDRPILYVVYSRPWFRDGFNFGKQPAVSITPKQLKKVPKKLRKLFA